MSERTKVNGEHLSQLDQSLKVYLYRDEDIDGVQIPLVCCESGCGFFFVLDNQKDNWIPAVFTVRQARYRISQSWFPASSFYVREVA